LREDDQSCFGATSVWVNSLTPLDKKLQLR